MKDFFIGVFSKIKAVHVAFFILLLLSALFGVYLSLSTTSTNKKIASLHNLTNTTIVPAKGAYAYENKTNGFQSQFKEKPTASNSIVFSNNLGNISFFTPAKQSFGTINSNNPPKTDGSIITYPEIFPSVDLKYTISSTRLLEEFIVKDATTATSIVRIEQIATTKSTYVENDDGSITFSNKDRVAFTLPHPVMYEINNQESKSDGIVYEIKQDKNQLIITKVITDDGKAWLTDPKRIYPVAIDLVIDNADTLSETTVIDNADTSSNWTSSDATPTTVSQETTIKQEGTGSVKTQTTARGAPVNVDLMEYSSDGTAQTAYVTNGGGFSATGGTITTSGGYTIHTFTSSGTFSPNGSGNVEYLVVGGGGGGGGATSYAGGGGAGGFRTGTGFAVTAQAYSVTIGDGGGGGNNGNDSVFSSITSAGGGHGGPYSATNYGAPGGSGGGGIGSGWAGGAGNTPSTSPSQGNTGGTGGSNSSGGGGGAGAVGANGSTGVAGNGGAGTASSISGTSVTYAGGGGGGALTTAGSGGSGGGGNGAINGVGSNGTANTGGGGGGGGNWNNSGAGGSGIVIIRYPNPTPTLQAYNSTANGTGGTITTSGGNTIHTFTSSGTFTPSGSGNVEYLVVAGGGGGGRGYQAGGGGAGGFRTSTGYAVSGGSPITVTVGGGGAGSTGGTMIGANGSNSVFGSITSVGGGGGSSYNAASAAGIAGGSGGGAGCNNSLLPGGAVSPAGQGNAGGSGGSSYATPYSGGGGGGAGGAGTNGCNTYGDGGVGTASSISGTLITYAGGGGGGTYNGARVTTANGGGGTGGVGTGGTGGFANTPAVAATANTGGGGGGGGDSSGASLNGANGGSGIVIVSYSTPSAIKSEGSYSLKGIANITTSLNNTLTRTIASPLNLSNKSSVTFDIRSSRTGSNIKVGIHDVGGTTTEVTPNITQADTFQSATIDLSGVTNANKDAIDQIIITIVNADAANTFYLDNMTATAPSSTNDTVTRTTTATNLSAVANITYWVRSSVAGSFATFGFGEAAATEQTQAITINQANTWEQKSWNIEGITGTSRDAVTKYAITFTGDTSGAAFYLDDIQTNNLFTPTLGTATSLSDTSIRWNFTDNSTEETGFKIYNTSDTPVATGSAVNLTYVDETGLTPNTQYTRKIGTYNASSTSITSGTVSEYTLAAIPSAPLVTNRTNTTVQVNPDPSTNAASTTMAIYKETGATCDGSGGSYIAANGSDNGATAVWQTDAAWGTAGVVTVTGLDLENIYSFCVKAKNANAVETAFSSSGQNNSGYIPISGSYVFTSGTPLNSSAIVTRYQNRTTGGRYIFGVDNGTQDSDPNTAIFEVQNGILNINALDTLVTGSLRLTGGSVQMATSGGEIKIGEKLWAIDADVDGYTSDGKLQLGSKPTGGRRKGLVTTLAILDCGESTYSTTNVCCTANGGACGSDGTCCSTYCGTNADNDSYFSSAAGHTGTCKASALAYTDCNDANASLYRSVAGYLDNDGDGYGAGAYATCVGASGTYRASGADCYDGNASAYPGSGACSAGNRGDGSYDYNCSGGNTLCGTQYYHYQYQCIEVRYPPACDDCFDYSNVITSALNSGECGTSGAQWGYPFGIATSCQAEGSYIFPGPVGTQACQ